MDKYPHCELTVCVPSNPCMNEECPKHVAACVDKYQTLGMADLSIVCKEYQPLIPKQLDLFDAYDFDYQ